MIKYIIRRLLGAIPVLFGLSIILFAFVHLLPGDPVTSLLGQHATPELRVEILKKLGLDRPLYEQYLQYLGQLGQWRSRPEHHQQPDGRPGARRCASRRRSS